MEIKNAQITNVKLCIEDHGILTFNITLHMLGGGCVLGGYALDQSFMVKHKDGSSHYEVKSSPAGLDCMRKIMEVVGVRSWEDLVGKYIRYEDNGWGSSVTKIGNILENEWIDIKEFMDNYDYDDWCEKYKSTKRKGE